jgi:DnaJ-class molecular chaperone
MLDDGVAHGQFQKLLAEGLVCLACDGKGKTAPAKRASGRHGRTRARCYLCHGQGVIRPRPLGDEERSMDEYVAKTYPKEQT